MYQWRMHSDELRREILAWRKAHKRPWHAPPHYAFTARDFHMSAACYEHAPVIGENFDRLEQFSWLLLDTLSEQRATIHAWCVLPNHYHVLVGTLQLKDMSRHLGRLHGRTSHQWNGEDDARGRQVWYRASDRAIRSDRHFWATMNYIHHNPVKHGYVERWQDWPWSSAMDFINSAGRERAEEIWRRYPVLDYGAKWDNDP